MKNGLTYEQLIQDETLKRAVVRSLEIIGEATKKIEPEIKRSNPKVQWREMAGMRDRLIHNYAGVNYRIVWDILKNKIPALRKEIKKILKTLIG
ncbi:DUF86 domain-containing protein [Membranicola marinus]|uniref:DUF86 domain-containing protein n=1 Tax=Membranihabitans marinus TaxID=1227546 RepID=A0A953HLE6_9BACT|nr:DUF86 domain-containing protein [Membranihabitans marinus]MBY5958089.1 DUF86 domain-containing protein [Membranihabitans marinus]